jgi:hypothetical protein
MQRGYEQILNGDIVPQLLLLLLLLLWLLATSKIKQKRKKQASHRETVTEKRCNGPDKFSKKAKKNN